MLNEFKTNFFGGTRSNRFLVNGTIPGGNSVGTPRFTKYHIRSTILPQVMSTTLTYDHFGRKYFYPGEKQYTSWAFVVLDDTGDKNLWRAFQNWQNNINNNNTNVSSLINQQSSYKATDWEVHHLDLNGETVLKKFVLHGCWPAKIGQLTLNMMSPNTMNSFEVMIMFDYMEILSGTTPITRRT
jgi:hypothetical protein